MPILRVPVATAAACCCCLRKGDINRYWSHQLSETRPKTLSRRPNHKNQMLYASLARVREPCFARLFHNVPLKVPRMALDLRTSGWLAPNWDWAISLASFVAQSAFPSTSTQSHHNTFDFYPQSAPNGRRWEETHAGVLEGVTHAGGGTPKLGVGGHPRQGAWTSVLVRARAQQAPRWSQRRPAHNGSGKSAVNQGIRNKFFLPMDPLDGPKICSSPEGVHFDSLWPANGPETPRKWTIFGPKSGRPQCVFRRSPFAMRKVPLSPF